MGPWYRASPQDDISLQRDPPWVPRPLPFGRPESRKFLRDMLGDVRTLARDAKLFSPLAKPMWRICKIDGRSSRYRSEPQRDHGGLEMPAV